MRIHTIGLFIYSAIAILSLTLVWGFRQVPKLGELAEEQTRASLEQELTVIRGAVRAATENIRLRVVDALRAEGDATKHALDDSPLAAAALVDQDQAQWKVTQLVTKRPTDFSSEVIKSWLQSWPTERLNTDEAYFTKVGDYDGHPYFGVALRVRREAGGTAVAIGVLPASEFPLSLAADRARQVSVFDATGTALSLNKSAYVGASLRRQPLVSEMLESDTVNVRSDWINERGVAMLGIATRIADANLYAAVEARAPYTAGAARAAWVFLAISALGALAFNWALFAGQVNPLLRQLAHAEAQVETLRRLMSEAPARAAEAMTDEPLTAAELPQLDFLDAEGVEAPAPPAAPEAKPVTPIANIVDQALRALEPKLRELEVTVDKVGLGQVGVVSDQLQLQTAIEEVLKNAVEAMADARERRLTIAAQDLDGRITVTIDDSGPGVPKEMMPKIFEPFYTTRPQHSGVTRGLGLNVVRRIVEELGGSVLARNKSDQSGFTAELTWPRERRVMPVERAAPAPRPAPIPRRTMTSDLDLIDPDQEEPDLFATQSVRPDAFNIRRPKVRTLE